VRRLLLLATAVIAGYVAGCGGGGSGPTPPPPNVGFSNASLKGQYAFSMSGVDLTGAYLARTGSFIADGNGNITGGLEDVVSLGSSGGASLVSFTAGTYQIQSNGRGLVAFQTSAGGVLTLNMSMASVSHGFLVQTADNNADLTGTSSGSFNLATTTEFANTTLNGKYVFDFSGVSLGVTTAAPISIIGQFGADGAGNVTGGLQDTNDGNVAAPSGPTAISPGTFALDTTTNGSGFGRGTMAFGGRSFAFYIVDNTRIKVIEEDLLGGSSGDAVLQANTIPTANSAFTGSFTYLVGGAAVRVNVGSQGPDTRVARFTADGNGNITAISYDENDAGGYNHISQGTNISKATYAIDTANAGTGRGTFTFTDSSSGTFVYIFYASSATQFVLQDISAGLIADGSMLTQSPGPYTLAGSAGNYSFNWSGVQLGSNTAVPFEEDFAGQYVLSSASSNNVTGVVDYVELGLNGNNLFTGVGLTGVLTIAGDGTNNNNLKILLAGSPTTTITFQAYFATPTTMFLLSSDSTRTTAGIATGQTTP
jgi:hypothetical protein